MCDGVVSFSTMNNLKSIIQLTCILLWMLVQLCSSELALSLIRFIIVYNNSKNNREYFRWIFSNDSSKVTNNTIINIKEYGDKIFYRDGLHDSYLNSHSNSEYVYSNNDSNNFFALVKLYNYANVKKKSNQIRSLFFWIKLNISNNSGFKKEERHEE